jgi:multiple sugar transport system permease protein
VWFLRTPEHLFKGIFLASLNLLSQKLLGRSLKARSARAGFLFVFPAVSMMLLFLVTPVILAFSLGFTNAKFASPTEPKFIGIENFTEMLSLGQVTVEADPSDENVAFDNLRTFTKPSNNSPYAGMQILSESYSADGKEANFTVAGDALFWKSLLNTFIFAAVIAPLQGGLALALALLINSKIRGKVFFRTVYFIPVVTSMVVVSILWIFFYQKDGLANVVLDALIPGFEPVSFLANPDLALPAIIFMSAWQAVGFHMIIWLAGLQTIPAELYEAATVDGANTWQKFRAVTWPGLKTTFVFVLIIISIQAMGIFTQINVMTQGGPLDSTTTIVFHIFREGFRKNDIGYSSALAIVFFVIVVTISAIQRRLTKDKD